jgi:hypothetical protein
LQVTPHAPAAHVAWPCAAVVVQTWPQVWQLLALTSVSTQVPPHSVGVADGQPETHA